MQKLVSSPAILYMLGIIRSRPCDAVKVVARLPVWRAPWTEAMAPASDCISTTSGMQFQMFRFRCADHSSQNSPMGDDGVIGYMTMTSFVRWATEAAASFASTVIISFFIE